MKISRIKRKVVFIKGLAIIVAASVFMVACNSVNEIPANEVRSGKLNKVIMCPICPGESIDQATNDLSIQMRGIVRDQIEDGWSDEQILQFWIDRYGPSVILEPPRQGFGLVAWLLPPLGIAIAALALFFTLKLMRRRPVSQTTGKVSQVHLTENEFSSYAERIEAILNVDGSEPEQKEVGKALRSKKQGAG